MVLSSDTHLKLQDRVVSGASFLTGSVFECDLGQRRSVTVLCMLYKIRSNAMRHLYGALPLPYVPVRVTRGAVNAHRYTLMHLLAAEPSSKAGLLFPCHNLCGTILVTPYSMVWDWQVSRAGPMPFYWPSCPPPILSPRIFPFSSFILGLVLRGWFLRTDMVLIALSQPCINILFK